nr:unnamed protein product [Callosobruchus chinensis]
MTVSTKLPKKLHNIISF